MAQAPDQTVYTTIQYVNDRNGNRPPSIKDGNGTFFTISDAAVGMARNFLNQQVTLSFYVNQRGYHVATGINGQQLPRDNTRGGGQQGGNQQGYQQPQGQPHGQQQARPQGAPGITRKDMLITYSGLAKSIIESGGQPADLRAWVAELNDVVENPPQKQQGQPPQQQQHQQQYDQGPPQGHPAGDPPPADDLDDEIPF